ncbi:hypothetical protein Misp01_15470 [Microtetraspora sp. NBRC 13810]|uniref:copper resistance CopC family protein n=1 Tax=Microtetraspora sp. NBRC 13810 TaxID=3030990 RepID=UPI0024A3C96F|nr:copper resistance protein CopC [Microtetraspora sp. NBRC 13810]GLW06417.1 hypothetical protein Misp01_15470 [Microtetraspora sp. NBRC 13810]
MTSLPRPVGRTVLTALLCALFFTLGTPAALAHDRLKSSSPGKNAKVESVERIELDFTASIRLATIVLHDADGERVTVGKPEADGTKVTAEVSEPLTAGKYVIAWRVVSSDGHPITGEIPFTVTGSPTPTPSPSPSVPETADPSAAPAGSAAPPAPPASIAPDPASGAEAPAADSGAPGWIWAGVVALLAIGAGVWARTSRRNRRAPAE